jgi:hypothetical protein
MGSIRHWRFLLFEHDPIGKPVSKARVLPQVLAGREISALAITEPGGGSDVANLRTKRLVEPTSGSIRCAAAVELAGEQGALVKPAGLTGGELFGSDPDLQRPVWQVFFEYECLRKPFGEARQSGVYVFLRDRHQFSIGDDR